MRIGVISDTHGNTGPAIEKISLLRPDLVIHLGDYVRDADEIMAKCYPIPFKMVKGNCDALSSCPEEIIFDAAGKRILAAHGHKYGVKDGTGAIYFAGFDNDADIVLFGHTHYPMIKEDHGIFLINPGTAGYYKHTMSIIKIEGANVSAEIIDL